MLKRLEIKNFESHAHTVLDDLSPGFNLIRGPSNSGKSSIIRALRLVCFNEFTPDSIRLSSKFCEVTLTTDKGTVYVKRGEKVNYWEVTPNGQPTRKFEKIGVELLEDVIEVTGLRPVKLGNVEFNANIMDQLEGHFMMAELDGERASGSVRAQIIDEISGLSGIEGLIRDVSLDNLRNGKEAKRLEEEAKELEANKHDGVALASEESLLAKVDALVSKAEKSQTTAGEMDVAAEGHKKARDIVQKARTALSALPDVEKAASNLKAAETALQSSTAMDSLLGLHKTAKGEVGRVSGLLSGMPDCDAALKALEKASGLASKASEADALLSAALGVSGRVKAIVAELSGLPDPKVVVDLLDRAKAAGDSASAMDVLVGSFQSAVTKRDDSKHSLKEAVEELASVEEEIEEILHEVEFCPFCLKPIDACEEKHEPVAVAAPAPVAPAIPEPPVRKARKSV